MSGLPLVPAGPHRYADGRRDARRDELAMAAMVTLGERGYANTSLRDIASNSPFSHGVLHYYFEDKTELLIHGVGLYQADCIVRYGEVVEQAVTAEELRDRFSHRLAQTIVEDAAMHRLWFDLRVQGMFDLAFRPTVMAIDISLEEMIWRVIQRYAALAGRQLNVDSPTAYALFDGLFEQGLRGHTAGQAGAPAQLAERSRCVLPLLLV